MLEARPLPLLHEGWGPPLYPPPPDHAVQWFLGLWLLALALFEAWRIWKHKPTVSQWFKATVTTWLARLLWLGALVALWWHVVFGGPL